MGRDAALLSLLTVFTPSDCGSHPQIVDVMLHAYYNGKHVTVFFFLQIINKDIIFFPFIDSQTFLLLHPQELCLP